MSTDRDKIKSVLSNLSGFPSGYEDFRDITEDMLEDGVDTERLLDFMDNYFLSKEMELQYLKLENRKYRDRVDNMEEKLGEMEDYFPGDMSKDDVKDALKKAGCNHSRYIKKRNSFREIRYCSECGKEVSDEI